MLELLRVRKSIPVIGCILKYVYWRFPSSWYATFIGWTRGKHGFYISRFTPNLTVHSWCQIYGTNMEMCGLGESGKPSWPGLVESHWIVSEVWVILNSGKTLPDTCVYRPDNGHYSTWPSRDNTDLAELTITTSFLQVFRGLCTFSLAGWLHWHGSGSSMSSKEELESGGTVISIVRVRYCPALVWNHKLLEAITSQCSATVGSLCQDHPRKFGKRSIKAGDA